MTADMDRALAVAERWRALAANGHWSNEETIAAQMAEERLGPHAVALARALERWMPKHTHHADWCDGDDETLEGCICGRNTLRDFAAAVLEAEDGA